MMKDKEELIKELKEIGIIGAIGDAISIQDTNYKILYQNQACKDFIGDHVDEYCYKAYERRDHICEDCALAATFNDSEIHTMERNATTDKGIEYFEITASPLRDSTGKIVASIEVARNITERKNIDEKVKMMLDNVVIGISMISPKMEIIWLNKTFKKWFPNINIQKKPLCYQSFYSPPKEEICDYCPTIKAFKTGEIHSSETGVCADGKIYNVIATPAKDAKGITYVIETVEDITEPKKAVEALRESEERFRGLIDATFEGVVIYEGDKIWDTNQSFAKMFGYELTEIIGKSASEFITPESYELVKNNIQRGYEKLYEIKGVKKNGTTFELEVIGKNCPYKGRSARVAAMRDITERKQTEKALQKAHDELELRVEKRTSELSKTNKELLAEISKRKKIDEELSEAEKKLRIHANELEESNTALRVLLKQRESDKQEFEDNILSNIKHLILPYIAKLKKMRSMSKELSYLNILESNLNEIISPFSVKLSSKYLGFTPKEIQIANLIKDGKHNKDIMETLNISFDTVKTHRQNIRKKVGILKKSINLRVYLLSLK